MKKSVTSILAMATFLLASQVSFAAGGQGTASLSTGEQQVAVRQLTLEEFKQHMTELGIDAKTQEKLIAKKQRGELFDSEKPENQRAIAKDMQVSMDHPVKKHVYADGSVQIDSLSGGTSQCGTGYCSFRGVTVSHDWLGASASFQADYTIVYGTANSDDITNAYYPAVTTYGSTASGVTLSVTRPQEYIGSYTNPAEAQLYFQTQVLGGGASASYYVWLHVGQDSAREDNN